MVPALAQLADSIAVSIPTGGTSPFIGWAIGAAAVGATSIVTKPIKRADTVVSRIIRPVQPIIALTLPMLAAKLPIIGSVLASVPPESFAAAPVGTLVGIAALEGVKALFKRRSAA